MTKTDKNQKPPKPPKNLTGKTVNGVRPGQSKPFRKATLKEQEQRIDECVKLLNRGASKFEIHAIMEKNHNLHWRTVDDIYIVRAQEIRRKMAQMSKEDARDLVIGNLLDALRSGTVRDRLSAARELSEMYGLYAPKGHTVTTPIGQPFQVQDVTELPVMPKQTINEILEAFAGLANNRNRTNHDQDHKNNGAENTEVRQQTNGN